MDMSSLAADLILLFSTPSEEKALKEAATRRGLRFGARAGRYAECYPLGVIGTDRVTAVRCEVGPMGSGGSAATALFSKIETGATAIVTVGMCFGVQEGGQGFGDVVVSTALIPYDRREVYPDPTGVRPYRVDYAKASWLPANRALVSALRRGLAGAPFSFRVHFGALLSGGARIHSTQFREELVASVPAGEDPIVGGEMEGVGLLSSSPPDDPDWVIVKGISDFASDEGGTQVREHRLSACRNAVEYLFYALSEPVET
jgi:nucleoside phosphorylase